MSQTECKPPTVFVVDDDDDLRDSLLTLLGAMGYTARGFSSAEDFQEFYTPQPGCLILDIYLAGQSGIDLYRQLLDQGLRIPVIFMTAHADVSVAVAAMKTGAIEFLEKPFERNVLLARVEQALRIDAAWRQSNDKYQALSRIIEDLRDSDREVLALLIRGETNKAMAAKLFITQRAVELRRQRLMQRLGVKSTAELLELTITHRILDEVRHFEEQWPRRVL